MKPTFTPGSRYVKDAQVLHIKSVGAKVLTTRGLKTFEEMAEWTQQDKPERPRTHAPVSAKLTPSEKDALYKHFPSAAAAIRFALSNKK